jgi:hypothetical protein
MISISGAPGWKARILDEGSGEGFRVVTLAAWALVEDSDGATAIVGVVQRGATTSSPSVLVLADEIEGFEG